MRKFYFVSFLGISLIGGALLVNQLNSARDIKSAKKKTLTSKGLIDAYKQKKIDRRAAGYAKQDKPDKYLEYIHLLKTGGNPANIYPYNYTLTELKKAQLSSAKLKRTTAALDWKQRGPGNVGGRTRGFIVDPDDATGNTWFAGAVGGGVWKTYDGGTNWETITPDLPNLSVSCLAMASSNHQVIYAGTGEGFGNSNAITGNGVFISKDRGSTWSANNRWNTWLRNMDG